MKTIIQGTYSTDFSKEHAQWLELEMGQKYSKFVFVSDHDKGLEKSLQEVFPSNHATHCVHHIKQNVSTRYGKPCAEFGFGLEVSYSLVQEEELIKCIWSLNLKAMEYLSQIPLHHWHSTEWV